MYEIVSQDDQIIVMLSGSVSIANVTPLRKELEALDQSRDLIIEASQLDYIDSSGIACLIFAYSGRAKQGAKVLLKNPSDALMRVLDTLKFSSFFPLLDE